MTTNTELSTAEISTLFNMTGERLRQLAASGHFPKPKRGKWNLSTTASGLVEYLKDRIADRKDSAEFLKARERKMESDAQLAEIAIKEKQKQILDRASVELVWTTRKLAIRDVILNSELSKTRQDEILNELLNVKVEDYLERAKSSNP